MANKKLSVLIIARNEEKNLTNCLKSIKGVDEIVLLLDRTTDKSEQIAKNYNAKIIKGEWEIEGIRRNIGITYCKNNWILELDADEIVSAGLIKEIKNKITTAKKGYFLIPFDNFIGNKKVRYGWGASWGVGAAPRLSFKGCKIWNEKQLIHPSVKLIGEKLWLNNRIEHYVDDNISDMIKRLDRYTFLKAQEIRDNNKKIPPIWITIRRGITRFYKCYISRKGYKEGKWGFILALMASLYIILSYLRAELEDKLGNPKLK